MSASCVQAKDKHILLAFGQAGLLLCALALSACQPTLEINTSLGNKITGSAAMFAAQSLSSVTQSSVGSLVSACTTGTVSLHAVNTDGSINPTSLASSTIATDGSFSLSASTVDLGATSVEYVLQADGCGSTLYRPLTGRSDQKITGGSTMLALSTNVSQVSKTLLNQVSLAQANSLISQLDSVGATTLTSLIDQVSSNSTLSNLYLATVNVPPITLKDLPPTNWTITLPSAILENTSNTVSATVETWNSAYTTAYEWSLDGTVISNASTFTYQTTANSQGQHTLTLRLGADDGTGHINAAKPTASDSRTLQVANNVLATPPSMTLVGSANQNSLTGNVTISTGASLASCASFSSLALSENSVVAPILPSAYTITCTQSGTQTVPYTLTSSADGTKTLALWAMDAAGNISAVPSTVSLTLDRTAPTSALSVGSLLRGGSTASLTFSASDTGSGVQSALLEFAADGATYSTVTDLVSQASPYAWTVPSLDVSTAKLRLTVTDRAGNTSQAVTSAFTIDSTAPVAPTISLASSALTNSQTASVSVTCTADDAGVLLSESSSTPALTDANWQACSTPLAFTLSSGDATKSIYAFVKDTAGNIQSSAPHVSVVYDSTAPSLAFTNVPSSAQAGGSTFSLQWSVTEAHMTTAQFYSVDLSLDNGATWTNKASVTSIAGPLSGTVFNTTLTWPSVNVSQARVRVSTVDAAGNSASVTSSAFIIDSTVPTLSSFQLAGGVATVASPTVAFTLSASDALSGVAKYQISESSSYSGSGWITYSSSGNFTLSNVSGAKTVYAWVMDAAGNVSAPLSVSVTLSLSIPSVSVTGPLSTDTFSTGQTVPIVWSCSNTDGLDANPVSIQYTVDDGSTFTTIATGLTNNLSSTTGSYNWTLPNGVTAFRLMIGCKSGAGVVSNIFSGVVNTSGWSIYMGDPWYGKTNVAAAIAKVVNENTSGNYSVTGDDNNNIYYVNYNNLMKITTTSGYVSTMAGTGSVACTAGTGVAALSGAFKNPVILGLDSSRQNLLLADDQCLKIFSIALSTGVVTTWATLPSGALIVQNGAAGSHFLTKNRILLFTTSSGSYIYKLDLSTQNQTATSVIGDGTSTTTATADRYAVGTVVTGQQAPPFGNGASLFANADASRIYYDPYAFGVFTRYDWNGTAYQVGVASGSASMGGIQNCVSTDFDSYIYCTARAGSPAGRNLYTFDMSTDTLDSNIASLPFTANYNGGNLFLGSLKDRLVTIYTGNSIDTAIPSWSSAWTFSHVAGQPLQAMGNGTDITQVGLDSLQAIKYNSATSSLFVSTSMSYLRRILYSGSTTTISTVYNSNVNGQYNFNLAGTRGLGIGSCARDRINEDNFNFSTSPTSTTSHTNFLNNTYCDNTHYTTTYPPATGTAIDQLYSSGNIRNTQNVVSASNGLVYFSGHGTTVTNDEFIFVSDGTTITRVAGVAGAGSYILADSGGLAANAHLTQVWQMQEIASGTHAGDLLVWDGDLLRMVTIATDSAAPKIYDLYSFTMGSGYTAGTTFYDAYYDQSTEVSGAIGTGRVYYTASDNSVHKFVPNAALTSGVDTTYSFTGTTMTGGIRLTLHPTLGLLVTQPKKNRILRIASP